MREKNLFVIFDLIASKNRVTRNELKKTFGINDKALNMVIDFLEKFNFVRRDGDQYVLVSELCRPILVSEPYG